jgi:hypothetical protein
MIRFLVVVLLLLSAACNRPSQDRPNIVFVLADDLNARLLPYLPGLEKMFPPAGSRCR